METFVLYYNWFALICDLNVIFFIDFSETPVRLFKHQIQTEAGNAPKTNSAKPTSPHISQLILSVVSQCKHRGGISMAELKQMLAAGGYDVAKNNRRVNIETKRLVNNETLVRTTRNASFRLNHKVISTKCSTVACKLYIIQVRTIPVKTPKPKAELKLTPKTATSKSPKGAENQKRRVLKIDAAIRAAAKERFSGDKL
uniref:H15 domain-containing protein n=1 Tax=Pundamilia nyererei TaxID=303518 RepID=A0A3B4HAT0_9CICH